MKRMGGIAIKRDKSYGVVAQIADKFKQEDELFLAWLQERAENYSVENRFCRYYKCTHSNDWNRL